MKRYVILFLIPVILFIYGCSSDTEFPVENSLRGFSTLVYPDKQYENIFNINNTEWNGADLVSYVSMPDGRIVWFLSRTILKNNIVLSNGILVQSGDELLRSSFEEMKDFFVSPDSNMFYTPLTARLYNNTIEVLLALWRRTGDGEFNIEVGRIDIATVSPDNFSLLNITPALQEPDIVFGSEIYTEDNYTYIFGIKNDGFLKHGYIARIPQGTLTQPWLFFDGNNWVSDINKALAVINGASDRFSITKISGAYYCITQGSAFSSEINLYSSSSLTSGWKFDKSLYGTPESNSRDFTFNAALNKEKSNDKSLFIYYNISSFDNKESFFNPERYRPRFIEVRDWR